MDKPKWTPGPLTWIDADDWRETAERNQPFTICDAANNDVATVYHSDHASVTTTPEQAAAYCRMFVAASALYEAAQAHRAWSYAEKHGLGSWEQRGALCSHAESLTLRAMAQADGEPAPAYKGTVGMTVWPHVELTETEEAEGRALVALCLEHERAALRSARVEG